MTKMRSDSFGQSFEVTLPVKMIRDLLFWDKRDAVLYSCAGVFVVFVLTSTSSKYVVFIMYLCSSVFVLEHSMYLCSNIQCICARIFNVFVLKNSNKLKLKHTQTHTATDGYLLQLCSCVSWELRVVVFVLFVT